MRADMNKVVTERPRAGGGDKEPKGYKKNFQDTPLDEQPKRESMRKKWKVAWQDKQFTDVLGPLRRYLEKQVGRPWNKVFSEINEKLPRTGGVSLIHIHGHVESMVTQNVVMKRVGKRKLPFESNGEHQIFGEFYVNPAGILQKNPEPFWRRWRHRTKEEKLVHHVDGETFAKVDGIWFRLVLATFSVQGSGWRRVFTCAGHRYHYLLDVFTKCDASLTPRGFYVSHHSDVVCLKKLQLNSREVRRLEKLLGIKPTLSQKPSLV